MVEPSKMASGSLPPLVRRKTFGKGQGGTYVSRRFTARGDNTSMPCAASPPNTFCQDQVVASNLSQGSGIANTAEVASQGAEFLVGNADRRVELAMAALEVELCILLHLELGSSEVAAGGIDRGLVRDDLRGGRLITETGYDGGEREGKRDGAHGRD